MPRTMYGNDVDEKARILQRTMTPSQIAESLARRMDENAALRGSLSNMKMLAGFLGAALLMLLVAYCATPGDPLGDPGRDIIGPFQ